MADELKKTSWTVTTPYVIENEGKRGAILPGTVLEFEEPVDADAVVAGLENPNSGMANLPHYTISFPSGGVDDAFSVQKNGKNVVKTIKSRDYAGWGIFGDDDGHRRGRADALLQAAQDQLYSASTHDLEKAASASRGYADYTVDDLWKLKNDNDWSGRGALREAADIGATALEDTVAIPGNILKFMSAGKFDVPFTQAARDAAENNRRKYARQTDGALDKLGYYLPWAVPDVALALTGGGAAKGATGLASRMAARYGSNIPVAGQRIATTAEKILERAKEAKMLGLQPKKTGMASRALAGAISSVGSSDKSTENTALGGALLGAALGPASSAVGKLWNSGKYMLPRLWRGAANVATKEIQERAIPVNEKMLDSVTDMSAWLRNSRQFPQGLNSGGAQAPLSSAYESAISSAAPAAPGNTPQLALEAMRNMSRMARSGEEPDLLQKLERDAARNKADAERARASASVPSPEELRNSLEAAYAMPADIGNEALSDLSPQARQMIARELSRFADARKNPNDAVMAQILKEKLLGNTEVTGEVPARVLKDFASFSKDESADPGHINSAIQDVVKRMTADADAAAREAYLPSHVLGALPTSAGVKSFDDLQKMVEEASRKSDRNDVVERLGKIVSELRADSSRAKDIEGKMYDFGKESLDFAKKSGMASTKILSDTPILEDWADQVMARAARDGSLSPEFAKASAFRNKRDVLLDLLLNSTLGEYGRERGRRIDRIRTDDEPHAARKEDNK